MTALYQAHPQSEESFVNYIATKALSKLQTVISKRQIGLELTEQNYVNTA